MMHNEMRDSLEAVDSMTEYCDVDIRHTFDSGRSEVSDAQSLAEYGAQFEGSEVGANPY